jgi:hypothetical protein
MALGQHQPVVSGMFHQATARLHQPLLQAGQRPTVNPSGQHQPPPQVPQVVSCGGNLIMSRFSGEDG